jgi:hypothetical protein
MRNNDIKATNQRLALPGLLLFFATLTTCAIPNGSKGSKGVRGQEPWQSTTTAPKIDFKEKCGTEGNATPNTPLLAQEFQSLNFVINSDILAIKARVEANAALSIKAMSDSTTQKTNVNITKALDMRNNATPMSRLITLIGAKISAASGGGTKISRSMPRGDWLKLTDGTNPEFKDLLCVATGSISQVRTESPAKEYVFSPAYVASLNPLASPEQYQLELGQGRKFNVTATLMDVPGKRPIQSAMGTVTFKPVPAQLRAVDPLTGTAIAINSETAWEVISDFSGLSQANDQLSGKLTFYISHKNKKFDAIVQESTRPGQSGVATPPIILIAK